MRRAAVVRLEVTSVLVKCLAELVGAEERPADHHGEPESRSELDTPVGGEDVHRDPLLGGGAGGHVGLPAEVVAQLDHVLREGLDGVEVATQRSAHRWGEADRAPEAEVHPARVESLEREELLGHDERLVEREHHAARPEPDP